MITKRIFSNIIDFLPRPCFIFANAAQKLADEPRDRPIQVRDHSSDKVYCYDPSFSKGDGYIYLNYCEKSKSARYDVFERISYYINDTWYN